MRFRMIFALLIVTILIGGSTYIRFAHAKKDQNTNLIALDTASTTNPIEDTASVALADLSSAQSTSTSADLTDTDLIARQLVSDYLDLAANGQDTDDNIATLADKYTSNISNIDNSTKINISNLNIVTDTKEHFQNYADSFTAIYAKYEDLLSSEYNDNKDEDMSVGQPALLSFSNALEVVYGREAKELQSLPVPASLSDAHMRLINNYLSSESSFASIQDASKDPANAFAGIVIEKKNQEEEQTIIAEIEKILTDNGI
jgi:hypothetical protein